MIEQSAIVRSQIVSSNVSIGAYSVIAADVTIGNDVTIHPHVVVNSGVVIGNGVEIFPGACVGREPKGLGTTSRQPHFERRLRIADGCSIGTHAVIYYDVEIGANTLVGDGASIREQCAIGERCIIGRYVTINYTTTIGDGVKIMDHAWLAGNMRIGNKVFISGGVLTSNDNDPASGYDEGRVIGPVIEDGALLGVGATVLPNVRIGSGAIVGACSLVTKDIEAGTVVMGVPARFVRSAERRRAQG